MKNILILTDFSENAKAAEKYALQLATRIKADLILYNAYPHRQKDISGNLVWPHSSTLPSFELQSISNLQARVDDMNHELAKIKDDSFKPEIRHLGNEAPLTDKLNDAIEENNVWLIVMGTKGESFANNVLFGSNVFKVLEAVNRPVLIVPYDQEYKNLKKIGYATDFRTPDLEIINWLYEVVEALKLQFHIVHVSSNIVSDEEKEISKKQEKLYREKFPWAVIESYEGQNIQHSLHEITEQMNLSMLALMHRKYDFFENLFHTSISHKMIKHTGIPILIFPGLQE